MKKKGVLLVAHGSRREEANRELLSLLERLRSYYHTSLIEAGFMELASPGIDEAVERLMDQEVEEVVVLPFFLFSGMHTTKDIPRMVRESVAGHDGSMAVRFLKPVGTHPLMFDILREELFPELSTPATMKDVPPQRIEEESMAIIDGYIQGFEIPEDVRPVVKRVVHTTGDFEYVKSLVFGGEAVKMGIEALRRGCSVYTDVTMVKSGINKRYGHRVVCVLNEEGIREMAEREGMTRAAASIRSLSDRLTGSIVAIGNAPTALLTLLGMVRKGRVSPALVVATPVGFVNAREAKLYLETLESTPYITNRGFKGGSTVAAAIVNALIKMAFEK